MAFDINGNLYVADESYDAINEYSPAHKLLQQDYHKFQASVAGCTRD